ncbi:MAG: tetratricopeptide repeat protein [Pseudomonadota bacterium]
MSFSLQITQRFGLQSRLTCGLARLRLAALSGLLVLLVSQPAALADYDAALAAYKRGDYAEALPQLLLEAQDGNPRAQNLIGRMYDEGHGVPENDAVAVHWYRLAAEQGFAWSQFNLGLMYLEGTGVETDESAALEWFRKAAEQGHARAQNRVGLLYDSGRGVAEDDTVAVGWYRKSAEQGFASAQYNLGLMYEAGTGVVQDYGQALHWMREAAAQDHQKAKDKIPRLEEQLTEAESEAADGNDGGSAIIAEGPTIYDPKALGEAIDAAGYQAFDQMPRAFGDVDAGGKYLAAMPGTMMPGFHGSADFRTRLHNNSLTYFVFDSPAAAREGFERLGDFDNPNEASRAVHREVWDEQAGRNIDMFCEHPALSKTAPPRTLACGLHDPHTQIVVFAEVFWTLKTAEERKKIRNAALSAAVSGLTTYRERVLPAVKPLEVMPGPDQQSRVEDESGAADGNDGESVVTAEGPAVYDPTALAAEIEIIGDLIFDKMPPAFGDIIAIAGEGYKVAEPGAGAPGFHGRAEFVSELFNTLYFFVFDNPASALDGFESLESLNEQNEAAPVVRRDVWDEQAGRNISIFCSHPTVSQTAPPAALECMLHDPHTQIIVGAEVLKTLETAEQREHSRNAALDAVVAGLTGYREWVLPNVKPLSQLPGPDQQGAVEDESAPADLNLLIAELMTPDFRASLTGALNAEKAIEPPFAEPQTQVYQEADPAARERGLVGRVVVAMNEGDSQSGIEVFVYRSAKAAEAHLPELRATPESAKDEDDWSLRLSEMEIDGPSSGEPFRTICGKSAKSGEQKARRIRCAHHSPGSQIALATYAYLAKPPTSNIKVAETTFAVANVLQAAIEPAERVETEAKRAQEEPPQAQEAGPTGVVLAEMTRLASDINAAVATSEAYVNAKGGSAVRLLRTRGAELTGRRLLVDRYACLALQLPNAPEGDQCRSDDQFTAYPLEIDLPKVEAGSLRVQERQREQGVRGYSVSFACKEGAACGRVAASGDQAETVALDFGETLARPALFLGCRSQNHCVTLIQNLSALVALSREAPAGTAAGHGTASEETTTDEPPPANNAQAEAESFKQLVAELDAISRGSVYGTYSSLAEWKRFFRGKSISAEPDGSLRIVLSTCNRERPDARVSECAAEEDWSDSVTIGPLDRLDPDLIYTEALDPNGKPLVELRIAGALDALRFNDANTFSLIGRCASRETCVHYEAAGDGDRLYIPCPDQAGCTRMEAILKSLVEAASAPSFDTIVTALKADSFPRSSIEEMREARQTARRLGSRLSSDGFEYHLTGFDYLLEQMDAELIDEQTLVIINKFCLPDEECKFTGAVTQIDLNQIDRDSTWVEYTDQGVPLIYFICKSETACVRNRILRVVDELPEWIITCKDKQACDNSLKDLLSLAAFTDSLGGVPDSQGSGGEISGNVSGGGLVGVWAFESPFRNGWVTEFRADGTFVFTNANSRTDGTYEASDGVLIQRVPNLNFDDRATYRFLDEDTLEITGRFGASIWKRQ